MTHHHNKLLSSLGLLLLISFPLVGQEKPQPYILITGVPIRIGMTKSDVVTKLTRGAYSFKKVEGSSDYWILDDGKRAFGGVGFDKTNRVAVAQCEWTPTGSDQVSLAGAVFAAIQDIERRYETKFLPVVVRLSSVGTPGDYQSDNIVMRIGEGHELTINIFTSRVRGDSVTVEETLTYLK